jgi:hypothetical protein
VIPRRHVVAALGALALAGSRGPATADEDVGPPAVRFASESVSIAIFDSSAVVVGRYVFEADAPMRLPLLVPLPEELAAALVDSVEARLLRPGGGAEPVPGERDSAGWHGVVPIGPSSRCTLEVRYRQTHRGRVRYILTSTATWGRPLESAEFVVTLAGGSWTANLPFTEAEASEGRRVLRHVARDFMPREDLILVRADRGAR